MPNLVECGGEGLVPVGYMAEIAFDPFGCRGYVECERVRAIVSDVSGVIAVARCAKARDDKSYIWELCWLVSVLTCS